MHPKVTVSVFAGAVVSLAIWIIHAASNGAIVIPNELIAPMTTIVLVVFAWLTPGTWQIPVAGQGKRPASPPGGAS